MPKKKRKYGKSSQNEVKKEMRRYKKGTAQSGPKRRKVKSRKQAIAIALSKARKKGAKVPKKKPQKRKTSKRTQKRQSTAKTYKRKSTAKTKKGKSGRKTQKRKITKKRSSKKKS